MSIRDQQWVRVTWLSNGLTVWVGQIDSVSLADGEIVVARHAERPLMAPCTAYPSWSALLRSVSGAGIQESADMTICSA